MCVCVCVAKGCRANVVVVGADTFRVKYAMFSETSTVIGLYVAWAVLSVCRRGKNSYSDDISNVEDVFEAMVV